MQTYYFLLIFFVCYICVNAHVWKRFRLGRAESGNLGRPADLDETKNNVGKKEILVHTFIQNLDHFDPTNLKTWNQNFFVNDEYQGNPTGPVFLLIGGEGALDPQWIENGAWLEYAKSCKALCFALEHRFYGTSVPEMNTSLDNLKYLSSKQALADLANFIEGMNKKYYLKKKNKWIIFGGSYSGSLAAWMRLKYPHLVFAAVSSSAPLEAKLNFDEYFKVVVKSINEETGNDNCINALFLAQLNLLAMIHDDPDTVQTIFKLCKPLYYAGPLDFTLLFNSIVDYVSDIVQYNKDYRFTKNTTYRNITINTMCNIMTTPYELPISKLARFTRMMLLRDGDDCFDYSFNNMIRILRYDNVTGSGARQWFYQTCTEFGFYQTSYSAPKLCVMNLELEYFLHQCQEVFDITFNKTFVSNRVKETNMFYGGLDIQATRVLYVHGTVDPWHALALNATRDPSSPVIYIKGTAHCANDYPSNDKDLPALKAARKAILRQLLKWTA